MSSAQAFGLVYLTNPRRDPRDDAFSLHDLTIHSTTDELKILVRSAMAVDDVAPTGATQLEGVVSRHTGDGKYDICISASTISPCGRVRGLRPGFPGRLTFTMAGALHKILDTDTDINEWTAIVNVEQKELGLPWLVGVDLSRYSTYFLNTLANDLRTGDDGLLSFTGQFDVRDINTDGETPLIVIIPAYAARIAKYRNRSTKYPVHHRTGQKYRHTGTRSSIRSKAAAEVAAPSPASTSTAVTPSSSPIGPLRRSKRFRASGWD